MRISDWSSDVCSSDLAQETNMALHFELVTPAKLVRSEDVHMVVVPGSEGDFGVLEGHAPFMSTIRDGALQVFASANGQPETIMIERSEESRVGKGCVSTCRSRWSPYD